mmetsp:Transcript_8010/g.14184  ORF Transcript_8010/g.14184 Transcript_8010/m.14184 type:complete len:325 (+) Transcript_8010:298-1272(+)
MRTFHFRPWWQTTPKQPTFLFFHASCLNFASRQPARRMRQHQWLLVLTLCAALGITLHLSTGPGGYWESLYSAGSHIRSDDGESEGSSGFEFLLQGKNKAYAALTSWPAMPQFRKFVEGSVIIPLGARTAARRQRAIFIFDWDPVGGSMGITLSRHNDKAALANAKEEAAQAWKALGGDLSILQKRVLLGTRLHVSDQWFFLSDTKCESEADNAAVEATHAGDIFLLTSSNVSDLLSVAFECPEASKSMLLVKGFSRWGQADLEQEVMSDTAWPCENISRYIFTWSANLYDAVMAFDEEGLPEEILSCREGIRVAEEEATKRNN